MKRFLYVLAVLVGSSVLAHAQTIADIARQERARRQASPNTIIITNRNKAASSSAKTSAESKPAEPAPTSAPADGRDEKWWRSQFEKARSEVQRLQAQIPLLEANLNSANREFLTRSYDPDGRGQK